MIGQQIGNFRIVSQLGAGGMGEVFLAEHDKIGTKVAIKMLKPHISADTEHVQRFFNEAIAASKIQHAGIGKIFDVGHTGTGRAYLVMEFLDGETLASRIKRLGRLPLPQVADIGKQISGVLDAVHRAGITHRDLKPDNVFLIPDSELASGERVKILDFGIAKLSGHSAGLTATASGSMGTPAYMSPEQWKNSKNVDWRADAYSLGCLAFEMTVGQPPFVVETIGEACAKHLTEEPPRLASLLAVPPQLDQLVGALLAKNPEQRPPSMRDIGNAFGALAVSSAGLAATMPSGEVQVQQMPSGMSQTPHMMVPSTTLGAAASSSQRPAAKKGKGLVIGLVVGGVAVAGIATAAIVVATSSDKPDKVAEPANPNAAELADAVDSLGKLIRRLDKVDSKLRIEVDALVAAQNDADRAAGKQRLESLQKERRELAARANAARDKVIALGGKPPAISVEQPIAGNEAPPTLEDKLRAEELEAMAKKYAAAAAQCFTRADASVKKVGVTLAVAPDGSITKVELADGAATHTYGQCLAKLIQGWKFRASSGGTYQLALARPAEPAGPVKPPPPPTAHGTLVLASRPPICDVLVDGKPAGRTPTTLQVAAGKHQITFVNRNTGRRETFTEEVKPNEETRVTRDVRGRAADIHDEAPGENPDRPPRLPNPDGPTPALVTLDRAGIQVGVGSARSTVMACGSKFPAKGAVKVGVKVNPDGSVASVTVKEAPDPALGSCVANALKNARFPKSQTGGNFSYPFIF